MDHSHSLLLVLFGAVYLGANPVESFGETHMVPMRDGIRLQTVITMPLNPPGSKCAVVMDRSPYGKDFLELLSMLFLGEGFASIRQDMRGTKGSEGNSHLPHEVMAPGLEGRQIRRRTFVRRHPKSGLEWPGGRKARAHSEVWP